MHTSRKMRASGAGRRDPGKKGPFRIRTLWRGGKRPVFPPPIRQKPVAGRTPPRGAFRRGIGRSRAPGSGPGVCGCRHGRSSGSIPVLRPSRCQWREMEHG